ncbi:hypothetical protein PIROE2DRAFT_9852 [Piromyces sp. E2]|nr:hypothetical protein PIROE2DRAFT_9852 [Piromyces sp. E2]|eukprot:OUM63571.1 hypothetical protein PIROE2DRAFT_9852 [Piromyces sp. E2]
MKLNTRRLVALFICIFVNLSVAHPTPSIQLEKRGWNSFWNSVKEKVSGVISNLIHGASDVASNMGIDTAAFGGKVLNMYNKDGIYHADVNCWQQKFGYNNLYDFAFSMGTSMDKRKVMFHHGNQNYILWAWKGDYVNLGAGAELGIYYGGKDEDSSHWLVDTNLVLPMTLTLTHRTKGMVIDNWKDTTWWITGFNPNSKFKRSSASDLTATYTVKFPNSSWFDDFNGAKKRAERGWTCERSNLTCRLSF